MILPLWYFALWIAAASACSCLCVLIISRGAASKWPSLLACAGFEVISYCVLVRLLYPHPYRTFFWTSWAFAGLKGLPYIWLGYDILRSIPAYKIVSLRTRLLWPTVGIAVAIAFTIHQGFPSHATPVQHLFIIINQSVIFAWAIVLMFCAYAAIVVGWGFRLTGLRIAFGMAIRGLSAMTAAHIYSLHLSVTKTALANSLDTFVGLTVTAFWCFTIARARGDEAAFRADLIMHRNQILPTVEKERICTITQ